MVFTRKEFKYDKNYTILNDRDNFDRASFNNFLAQLRKYYNNVRKLFIFRKKMPNVSYIYQNVNYQIT